MARHRLAAPALALLLLAGAVALKHWHRTASTADLGFMLRPVGAMVSALTGAPAVAEADGSRLFPALGIRIDRSCAGVNFLAIAMASFALVVLRHRHGGRLRPAGAALAALGAYPLAIVVNSGRITAMALAQHAGLRLAPRAHEAVGAACFLAALVMAVLLLDRLMSRPAA